MSVLKSIRLPSNVLVVALIFLATLAIADIEPRYKLALLVGVVGTAALAAMPERRIACLALWVLIHPLGVEKVFYVDAAEGPQFTDPTVLFNASDGPLVLLALFLIAESLTTHSLAFRWSRLATVLSALLAWSLFSYVVHAVYLASPAAQGPFTLMQDVRLVVFVVLAQSAIRTRGELVTILLFVGLALVIQTAIIAVSYSTGHLFTYPATLLTEGTAKLQGFDSSGGGQILRGTGTVGQVNEQAIFHVVMTFPMFALFASRNSFVAAAAIFVAAASGLAIVLTFSRGAWIAFPVGCAVWAILTVLRWKIGRSAILMGAGFTMCVAIALSLLAQPIYQRLAYGDTGATGARLRLMSLATDLFLTQPIIGVGPGEFDEAAMALYPAGRVETEWIEPGETFVNTTIGRVEYSELRLPGFVLLRPMPVHNKFMLMLSELGIPGLLIWLWLYAETAVAAYACYRCADKIVSFLGSAVLGLAAASLTYMMVEHFHDDKPLEMTLFGPVLVLCARTLLRKPRPGSQPHSWPQQQPREAS